jgi:hypothetical protein
LLGMGPHLIIRPFAGHQPHLNGLPGYISS